MPESNALPSPLPQHVPIFAQLAPRIREGVAKGSGRGLVVVRMVRASQSIRVSFSPVSGLDEGSVATMGVPVDRARQIAAEIALYDERTVAPTLLIETLENGDVVWSFDRIDVRRL